MTDEREQAPWEILGLDEADAALGDQLLAIKQINYGKMRELINSGVDQGVIGPPSLDIRINMILQLIFADDPKGLAQFDLQYETQMTHVLDAYLSQLTRSKIILPGQ